MVMISQRIDPLEVQLDRPAGGSPKPEPRLGLDQLRDRFVRNDGLPFADVLTEPRIRDTLDEHGVTYRDRVFTPITTLWGFLLQVLSEDQSCSNAVTRIIAHRAASGLEPCSPNMANYCNARGRLRTGVLRTLARRTAAELQAAAAPEWKWNGRGACSSPTGHTPPCRTRQRTRRPTRNRRHRSPRSASRWPGSVCSCRWRPAPATTWPSPRTPARGPARPRCCGGCMSRCRLAT